MLSSSRTDFAWSDPDRLFYIEGTLTIFVALVAMFVLPDFPSTSHMWLSPIEARLAEKRMEEDAGVDDEGQTEGKSRGKVLLDALTDWKVMYMALKYFVFFQFPECVLLIICMKHHLYHHLPLLSHVLPHPHRYTRI